MESSSSSIATSVDDCTVTDLSKASFTLFDALGHGWKFDAGTLTIASSSFVYQKMVDGVFEFSNEDPSYSRQFKIVLISRTATNATWMAWAYADELELGKFILNFNRMK